MKYKINQRFEVDVSRTGFNFVGDDVAQTAEMTNATVGEVGREFLSKLMTPTLSASVGDVFTSFFTSQTGTIANPQRNGYPDILPIGAQQVPREQLNDFPLGIELKTSAGSVPGGYAPFGKPRLHALNALAFAIGKTRCAPVLALVWDFVAELPTITAVFYAQLDPSDWPDLIGHGSVMKASGRRKLWDGRILIVDDPAYQERYMQLMGMKSGIEPWLQQKDSGNRTAPIWAERETYGT